MRYLIIFLCVASAYTGYSQSTKTEFKVGHIFYVSLPTYMKKTGGLNSSSSFEYKSSVQDVYGFVIEDNKEEMALQEIFFTNLTEFFDHFIKDFVKDEDKRNVSAPVYSQKNGINFVECDVSYFDKEANADIYYLVGIVETKTSFYKVLSWSTVENKEKFKADFQSILYSLRD